jgi:hypothetical protein
MTMGYHILNGDCLAETFKGAGLPGDVIVCREALVEGPVNAGTEERFWAARALYLARGSGAEQDFYLQSVKTEFDKISSIDPANGVYLWFEHDLFCQVNYWFTIDRLVRRGCTNVFRVLPQSLTDGNWEGFGQHSPADLATCFAKRVKFSKGDFTLGANLWRAYREGDHTGLAIYSRSLSPCFPRLEEVCKAEVERKRHARPQRALQEIMSNGYTSFSDIFHQFSKREGIYGFGDAQVDHMLRNLRA